jgi:hypothetical protein
MAKPESRIPAMYARLGIVPAEVAAAAVRK